MMKIVKRLKTIMIICLWEVGHSQTLFIDPILEEISNINELTNETFGKHYF